MDYKSENCVEAKLTRLSFHSVERKLAEPLIHIVLCDLESIPTKVAISEYFIVIVDGSTKYCYLYLLESKDIDKIDLYK